MNITFYYGNLRILRKLRYIIKNLSWYISRFCLWMHSRCIYSRLLWLILWISERACRWGNYGHYNENAGRRMCMGSNWSRINNRWFRNGNVLTSWYLQSYWWKIGSIKFEHSICAWLLYKMDIFISFWYRKDYWECI